MPNSREKRFYPLKTDSAMKPVKKPFSSRENNDIETRKARLLEAAQDFEAIFVRQLLKTMRSTLTTGGMFGSGSIGEIYSDIMDNAVAEKIAERSGLGLAESIYKQMIKSIESDNT